MVVPYTVHLPSRYGRCYDMKYQVDPHNSSATCITTYNIMTYSNTHEVTVLLTQIVPTKHTKDT